MQQLKAIAIAQECLMFGIHKLAFIFLVLTLAPLYCSPILPVNAILS